MALQSGTQLGAYKILGPLGAGGMGEVYRATDTRLHRDVAIKVLPADFAKDADRLRRFEQEARATSGLNHPNILTVYDIARTRTHLGLRRQSYIAVLSGWPATSRADNCRFALRK